ncbi:MAG: MgtC/SapB family protein [Pseudomonadota bacterium]
MLQSVGSIGVALALGLLIGIQRGWALRNEVPGTRVAGIRTYGLLGLTGGVAGIIGAHDGAGAVVLMGAAAITILLGYAAVMRRGAGVSATATLTGLLTLACGYLATTDQAMLATVISVATMIVLALRTRLHSWLRRLKEVEVNAIARFALIAIVILPLLPNRAYGPLDAWNPHELWSIVVMVSAVSCVGYIASRYLGASRGTLATAGAGAMVSSTAVTASLATRLRDAGTDAPILTAGIATASAVMLLRVLALAAVLLPRALPTLALLLVPAALVSIAATLWQLRRAARGPSVAVQELPVSNPFALGPALALMAVVMGLALVSRWVLQHYGDMGLATILALSGMVDVDSAIITMAGLPAGALGPRTAGIVLAVPVMLNTLLKAGLTISLAGWARGWRAAGALAGSALAAAVILAVLP